MFTLKLHSSWSNKKYTTCTKGHLVSIWFIVASASRHCLLSLRGNAKNWESRCSHEICWSCTKEARLTTAFFLSLSLPLATCRHRLPRRVRATALRRLPLRLVCTGFLSKLSTRAMSRRVQIRLRLQRPSKLQEQASAKQKAKSQLQRRQSNKVFWVHCVRLRRMSTARRRLAATKRNSIGATCLSDRIQHSLLSTLSARRGWISPWRDLKRRKL